MCDLAIIAARSEEVGKLTEADKALANVALSGILIYGTFLGRSGEWHGMDREKVKEKMLEGADRIICGKHKTAKYYGSIAKWIPDGLRKALLVYIGLPDKQSTRLFEPVKMRPTSKPGKHFHLGPALRAFGKLYTPEFEFPRVNLVRKMSTPSSST